jgi:hypothetical protein
VLDCASNWDRPLREAAARFGLHDLAAGVAWQRGHDVQDGRQLVAGDPGAAPVKQLVEGESRAAGSGFSRALYAYQ